MKEGLNLLPSVAKFQAAKIKLKKKINLGVGIVLGIWVVVVAIIFTLLIINNIGLKKAQGENDKAINQYKSLVDVVLLLKKNKDQVQLVNKVLKERFEYGASIMKVTELFSDKVVMQNFEIKDKKKFMLKGSLASGMDLIEVEEKVRSINSGLVPGFSVARLKSLRVGFEGWLFEMEVELI